MQPAGTTCPECGTPRPRRAAGCRNCGAIFASVVTPEQVPRPLPSAAREALDEPPPEAEPRGRLGGCGSCAILALLLLVLTLLAGGALFLLARGEFSALYAQFERVELESRLQYLARSLEDHAARHDGHFPESLGDLAPGGVDLEDPWGRPIRYDLEGPRGPARLSSLGADGVPGGAGADADVERIVSSD